MRCQRLTKGHQFQLVARRFARWKEFGSYEGDNRSFTTSNAATYRLGVFLVFDLDRGRITEGPTCDMTGTR